MSKIARSILAIGAIAVLVMISLCVGYAMWLMPIPQVVPHGTVEVSWNIDGRTVVITNPLDPPLTIKNNTVRENTVETIWLRKFGQDTKGIEQRILKKEDNCLTLLAEYGESRFIELLHHLNMNGLSSMECPQIRRIALEKELNRRRQANGEEAALKELSDGRKITALKSRARSALEIYPNAQYPKVVLAGVLLRQGLMEYRTGKHNRARTHLEEAILLLEHPHDKARGELALGLVNISLGNSPRAEFHFSKAVRLAPEHPAGKSAAQELKKFQ